VYTEVLMVLTGDACISLDLSSASTWIKMSEH